MTAQCCAYASISNAQAMRPISVGGFSRKLITSQFVLSGSSLEAKSSKTERRGNVCHATAAPGVSITPDLALH
jgi:hypothetical protein